MRHVPHPIHTIRLRQLDIPLSYPDRTHESYIAAGRETVMGLAIHEVCFWLRVEIGTYHWDQWGAAAERMGVRVIITDDPKVPVACLVDDTIVIREGYSEHTTAYMAWHELAHYWLHSGQQHGYLERPAGAVLIARHEQEANEFAETFPVWE